MKVKVLGNGITWVARPDTHFLLDDKILIDTPTGCAKGLYEFADLSKIKYIFITHFHQDHFMDLNVLFDVFRDMHKKVTVFAQKTARERLLKIMKATDNSHAKKKFIDEVFDFVEVKPNTNFTLDKYKVHVFPAVHKVKYAFSYAFEKDGVVIGFSGDIAYSSAFQQLIEMCNVIFVDTSNINKKPFPRHMSIDEIVSFKKTYPDKKFYSVHVNDKIYDNYQDVIDIPKVGEEFEF